MKNLANIAQVFDNSFFTWVADTLNIVRQDDNERKISFVDCLKNGFIVIDKEGKPLNISQEIFNVLKKDYYYNKTLFGNFSIPANMSDEEYYANQILHYFSTYGLESLGFKAQPYIPVSALISDERELENSAKVKVYIECLDEDYNDILRDYIYNLRNPKNMYTYEYETALKYLGKARIDIDEIKSYEIKAIYYKVSHTVPENAIDILRYLVYIITQSTLLIKNKTTIKYLKWGQSRPEIREIVKNALKNNLVKLSQIFFRFKPLFLAFKGEDKEINKYINKIRKLANTYHAPLSGLNVQNLIDLYNSEYYSLAEIREYIKSANTRDIFKLLNALANSNNDYKVYSIRNGKAYVQQNVKRKCWDVVEVLKNTFIDELEERYPDMKNKSFYIPDYIDYGLPISEKDMVGPYPNGTAISLGDGKDPITLGVAWNNLNNGKERVDIDLHLISATEHFGWNASRKNNTDTVIYSGDVTSAPNGAAEAYFIKDYLNQNYIIDTRLFTDNKKVPMSLFINKRPAEDGEDYIYDPNENIIPAIPLYIDREGMNIGITVENGLYLYNKSISSHIVPRDNYEEFINGLSEKMDNNWLLSDMLFMLGATIITNKDECLEDTIDLSPEVIDETTLFNIFRKD